MQLRKVGDELKPRSLNAKTFPLERRLLLRGSAATLPSPQSSSYASIHSVTENRRSAIQCFIAIDRKTDATPRERTASGDLRRNPFTTRVARTSFTSPQLTKLFNNISRVELREKRLGFLVTECMIDSVATT